jgi:hypothetical protein
LSSEKGFITATFSQQGKRVAMKKPMISIQAIGAPHQILAGPD